MLLVRAVQEGTVFRLRAISVTVLSNRSLAYVGSKMGTWHLSPGTASYQCLFLCLKKCQRILWKFGFKRDEWDRKTSTEEDSLFSCQVLPGILSARPQPCTPPSSTLVPSLPPQNIGILSTGIHLLRLWNSCPLSKRDCLENRKQSAPSQPMRSPQGVLQKSHLTLGVW